MFNKFIRILTAPIDTEAGELVNLPDFVIGLTVFMSANAILQAIADIVIETLVLTEAVPFKIPFRLEFLFLTLISTVIAYMTLKGLREGNLDVTKNTLLLGLIVESSLVIGDVYLLMNTGKDLMMILLVRLGFLILTSTNIGIISYILWRRHQVKHARPNYQF